MHQHVSSSITPPSVTVLICTRDRGGSILATLKSLLASAYPHVTLLVVDQSADLQTQTAVATLAADARLRYISTPTRGLSRALNLGLALSTSDLVLMTDDDCIVPPDWISAMVQPFLQNLAVGLVFCDVLPAPHDSTQGFIPVNVGQRSLLIPDLAHWTTSDGVNIGIGAGMAVRRSIAQAVGGFHPSFGAGSHFRSGNELEFGLHLLTAGYQIYRTIEVGVIHYGFRTHDQSRALLRRNLYGVGAVYGQLLRRGYWWMLRPYLLVALRVVIQPALSYLAQRQPPRVLGRAVWLVRGLIEGCLMPPMRCARKHESR